MLGALLVFLFGCLGLAVVIYVVNLLMDMLKLPPEVKQIALLILGLILFVLVLMLAMNVYNGAGVNLRV